METGEHCPYCDSSLSGNAWDSDNQREIEVAAFVSCLSYFSAGGNVLPTTLNVFVLGKKPTGRYLLGMRVALWHGLKTRI